MPPYQTPPVWEPRELPGSWGRECLRALDAKPWAEKPLQKGRHDLQLYSLGTPNGVKVTIMLEELGVEYDAWMVNIRAGEQFGSGFVEISPNAMIPCLVDHAEPKESVRLFESCAILLYLAEKFGRFLPTSPRERAECLSWLFWQSGSAPYMGVFNAYFFYGDPEGLDRDSIDRWTLEVKRQLAVLNRRLEGRVFICGSEPTIADFAIFPWVRTMSSRQKVSEFLSVPAYPAVVAWLARIAARPAVCRGVRVNSPTEPDGLRERHSRSDFEAAAYAERLSQL